MTRPGMAIAGWWACAGVTVAVYLAWVQPSLRLWRGVVTHGNTARAAVAFTFDDGPHPLWAPLLADSLERHGARGTFFLVGMEAQRYPGLTARLLQGGHQIASHSMTHPYPNLTALPAAAVRREVGQAQAVLAAQAREPRIALFRPPGGGVNAAVLRAVRDGGERIGWWSVSTADATQPVPAAIVSRLRQGTRPGAVVLLHQRGNTVAALEQYLANPPRGYRFLTFDDVVK